MSQTSRLYYALLAAFILLFLVFPVNAGCYKCVNYLIIQEIVEEKADEIHGQLTNGFAAVAAIGSLQYNLASNQRQWGLALSCFDSSSESCGGAFGLGKRLDTVFVSGAFGYSGGEGVINLTASGSW